MRFEIELFVRDIDETHDLVDIVHGPVVLPVDDLAASRFARAGRLRSRRANRPGRLISP